MQTSKDYLHVFLDMGDALLNSGAEIFRVEDTLNRMGYACGATHMNVFVITSSIVITMEFPGDGARTQTRRIHECGGNDFTKLEQLNDLSRRFCSHPVSAAELRNEFEKINANRPKPLWKLLGSVLAASSFALFYGGTIPDAITAGVAAILIWSIQKYLRPVCMNEVTFQFAASFFTGFSETLESSFVFWTSFLVSVTFLVGASVFFVVAGFLLFFFLWGVSSSKSLEINDLESSSS